MSASLPVSDEMDRERWWHDARLKRAGVVDFTGMTSSAPATIRGLGWRISFVLRFRRGPTAGMGSSKPDLQSYRLTTCHPETNRGYIPCSRHPREACSAPTRAKTGCRTEKYRLATFFAVRWALPQMKGNQKYMRSFHAPDSVCVPSANESEMRRGYKNCSSVSNARNNSPAIRYGGCPTPLLRLPRRQRHPNR